MKKYRRRLGAAVVAALLAGSAFASAADYRTAPAYAGASEIEVAATESITGSINQGTWFVRGVTYGDNSMVFGENSTGDTRAVSKIGFENYEEFGFDTCVNFDISLTFSSFDESAVFLISFGADRPTDAMDEAPATSIAFREENGSILVGVIGHEESDSVLQAYTEFPDNLCGEPIAVTGVIHTDGGLILDVNGKRVSNGGTGFATEGYMGFGQTGGTQTEITKVDITAMSYDRPENTQAIADFDNDEYNANEWYSSAMAGYFKPTSLAVEDGKLFFRNVAEASISTLHRYSNFEMTFDVPDIQRTANISEQTGELLCPVSGWFGVSMGAQAKNGGSGDAIANATVIYIEGSLSADRMRADSTRAVLSSYNQVLQIVDFPAEYHFWNPALAEQKGCVQVKISVVDGKFTAAAKWESDEEYWTFLEYELGYTPLGLLQIWGMGHTESAGTEMVQSGQDPFNIMSGSFSVDNIRIVNLDVQKQVTEVDFKTNRKEKPADFAYTDSWSDEDLLINILGKEA